jgi:small subunit ribosomal protein S14
VINADIRLTVEVHGLRVYVVFVRDSEPIWRLEVIGEQPVSREVGTVGQSLQNVSAILRVTLMIAPSQARSGHNAMVLRGVRRVLQVDSRQTYKVHQMLAEAKIRDFLACVDLRSCRSNPTHNSTLYIIMGGKAQVLRDMRKRLSADQFEVQRRAFLYVARNTALPNTIRHKAQLGLNALNGGEGRMHAVKNRCVETGRGRGELGDT